jgi:hypothetical protein
MEAITMFTFYMMNEWTANYFSLPYEYILDSDYNSVLFLWFNDDSGKRYEL